MKEITEGVLKELQEPLPFVYMEVKEELKLIFDLIHQVMFERTIES